MPAFNRVIRPLPTPAPKVSIIVPFRDQADMLLQCTDGILRETDYPDIELLIVDNGSIEAATARALTGLAADPRVVVLPVDEPYNFSRLNNLAVQHARGEVLVLLNNDTKVISPGWLTELVSHAVRPGVGAVGAKLLYEDGRLQHCGVTLGPGWRLTHQLRLADRGDPGPSGELAVVRTVSAVTGACMALRKSVYLEAGGLDEVRFKVSLNDIDLCLRLGDLGYKIVCTPFAELFHFESKTRGYDVTEAQRAVSRREAAAFRELWNPLLERDPFHNPNLFFDWDVSHLARPPRREKPWHGPKVRHVYS